MNQAAPSLNNNVTNTHKTELWYFAQVHSQFPSSYANNFQVMKMCSGFAHAGIKTNLVFSQTKDSDKRLKELGESVWDYYGTKENFKIKWMPFSYPFSKLRRSFHSIFALFYAKKNKVKLAYTRSEWIAILFNIFRVRTFLELHDINSRIILYIITKFGRKIFLETGIICISDSIAETLKQHGLSGVRLIVAHDAVDEDNISKFKTKSAAREALALSDDAGIVVYSGSLSKGRGIDVLFRAAELLHDVNFLIVGGREPNLSMWKNRLAATNIENISLIGFVPHARVKEYMFAADVLLMPHTKDCPIIKYTSPMKMFEYMASQRPIIASDFPVFREVLKNEQNALLVPESDAEEQAKAIKRLLGDKKLGERISKQAYEDVKRYTWSARGKKLHKFIF